MAQVSGIWRWQDAPDIEAYRDKRWSLAYRDDDGEAYSILMIAVISELVMIYSGDKSSVSVCSIGGNWRSEAYREIDFGETPQTVDDEFYAFLTANAVKLDLPDRYLIKRSTLKGIADAIRKKSGKSGKIAVEEMADEISALT